MKFLFVGFLLMTSCASVSMKDDCEKFCSSKNEKVVSCERKVLSIKHEVFHSDIYECEKSSVIIIH